MAQVKIKAIGAKAGESTVLKMLGHFWVAPVAAVMALFSQHDHTKEKKRIADEFRNEIGAQVGKSPDKVNVKDMEKVAKKTPAIGEALRRSTARRNLSIGVTVFGAAAGIGLAGSIASALVGSTFLVAPVIAFISFMAIEHFATKAGEKALKIEEPEFSKVAKKPGLQAELSVPSQITFLAHLHSKGQKLSEAQVLTVLVSSNPQLQAQIKSRYGVEFAGLPDNTKFSILQELSGKMDIGQLTDDINSGRVRVQELAFATPNQPSVAEQAGTARTEQADVPAMQQAADSAPDSAWQKRIMDERQQQATRLAQVGA